MTKEEFDSLKPGDIVRSKDLNNVMDCFRLAQDWEVISPPIINSIQLLDHTFKGFGLKIASGPHAGKEPSGLLWL